ncbi:histocompatibility antigen 60b-like [Meriones unguiculatus]|uniref:histocompatibility antigen 60b-like n=1 Tax=Meriones unguiculatus TaxID=10047 RepID=UPI00293E613E|nr:histocompatibility antigen 60b-like [Meriones unguiculatus]
MKEGASTKPGHSLTVTLLLLLSFLQTTLSHDADSLNCILPVKSRTTAGQCSLNGQTLLQYGNSNEDTLLRKLEKEGKAIQVCTILPDSLKEFLEEKCPESGLFPPTGNHTMNVTMQSQYKQGDLIDARWAFTIDGKHNYNCYLTNKTCRCSPHDAGSAGIQWEHLKEALRKLSEGNFRDCLKKLSTHLREEPRPKVNPQDTTQLSSATQIPRTVNTTPPTSASEYQHTSWILYLLPLIIALII